MNTRSICGALDVPLFVLSVVLLVLENTDLKLCAGLRCRVHFAN